MQNIRLVMGDITEALVDAIVNAANAVNAVKHQSYKAGSHEKNIACLRRSALGTLTKRPDGHIL